MSCARTFGCLPGSRRQPTCNSRARSFHLRPLSRSRECQNIRSPEPNRGRRCKSSTLHICESRARHSSQTEEWFGEGIAPSCRAKCGVAGYAFLRGFLSAAWLPLLSGIRTTSILRILDRCQLQLSHFHSHSGIATLLHRRGHFRFGTGRSTGRISSRPDQFFAGLKA